MIKNVAAYSAEGVRRAPISIEQISDVLDVDDGSFVWVGLYQPDEKLLLKMQEEFDLHPLAVEDALNAHQRSKIEAYGDSLFLVLHTAQTIDTAIVFGETHIFIGRRYLLTVRHGPSFPFEAARERCERQPGLMQLGPSYALHGILDAIVDNYFPIVSEFEAQLNVLENDVFAKEFRRTTIQRLYRLKRDLTKMRLTVAPMQDIIRQLISFHPELIREEVHIYLRDVHDHAVRDTEAMDGIREMLTAAMSVNLSVASVYQGEVVKRLAGWAGLIAAPTLVASWYGMNFVHMPELPGRYSYWIVMAVTLSICLVLYRKLKRAGWL